MEGASKTFEGQYWFDKLLQIQVCGVLTKGISKVDFHNEPFMFVQNWAKHSEHCCVSTGFRH